MNPTPLATVILSALLLQATVSRADDKAAAEAPSKSRPMSEILAASKAEEWRTLDPANLLYLDLPAGQVVIELSTDFAPKHVANIKKLAKQHYFDGLAILRSQDNYVVQWGDPDGGEEDASKAKSLGDAAATVEAEFETPWSKTIDYTRLPDPDVYAPEVGFSNSMPVGRDPATERGWLTHCYGMVGVGRGNATDSGSGAELYVVNGHAPRHLDHNVAIVGRVVQGMEFLSALPRGTGPLGFYEKPEQRTTISRIRVGSEVPESERKGLEVLRSDSASFKELTELRRNRRDDWYVAPAGHIELCNVLLPVRAR